MFLFFGHGVDYEIVIIPVISAAINIRGKMTFNRRMFLLPPVVYFKNHSQNGTILK